MRAHELSELWETIHAAAKKEADTSPSKTTISQAQGNHYLNNIWKLLLLTQSRYIKISICPEINDLL